MSSLSIRRKCKCLTWAAAGRSTTWSLKVKVGFGQKKEKETLYKSSFALEAEDSYRLNLLELSTDTSTTTLAKKKKKNGHYDYA